MSIVIDDDIKFTIKWACKNLPYIDFDDGVNVSNRIFLSKASLVAIIKEMQGFVDFYADEFSPKKINEKMFDEDYNPEFDSLRPPSEYK